MQKTVSPDTTVIFLIMLVSYILLILYFRSKGGYQAVVLKKEPVLQPSLQSIK